MTADHNDGWDKCVANSHDLTEAVRKSSAVNVNSKSLREAAREAVQSYFRSTRPALLALRVGEDVLSELDEHLQNLNHLSLGNNARASYLKELKHIKKTNVAIADKRELLIGMGAISEKDGAELSSRAQKIVETLHGLVPSAALSFEQVSLT